jgi:site-specific DNA-methyltransferase (adenine-specific)
MATPFASNTLFYGDNLEVLRKHFPNECIDLIYLDPPFNSKANYNILFKEKSGERSTAQVQAFSDFWQWDIEAMHAYDRLAMQSPKRVSDIIISMHDILGKNDMFAYLNHLELWKSHYTLFCEYRRLPISFLIKSAS